jgi:hypothetical protein
VFACVRLRRKDRVVRRRRDEKGVVRAGLEGIVVVVVVLLGSEECLRLWRRRT